MSSWGHMTPNVSPIWVVSRMSCLGVISRIMCLFLYYASTLCPSEELGAWGLGKKQFHCGLHSNNKELILDVLNTVFHFLVQRFMNVQECINVDWLVWWSENIIWFWEQIELLVFVTSRCWNQGMMGGKQKYEYSILNELFQYPLGEKESRTLNGQAGRKERKITRTKMQTQEITQKERPRRSSERTHHSHDHWGPLLRRVSPTQAAHLLPSLTILNWVETAADQGRGRSPGEDTHTHPHGPTDTGPHVKWAYTWRGELSSN